MRKQGLTKPTSSISTQEREFINITSIPVPIQVSSVLVQYRLDMKAGAGALRELLHQQRAEQDHLAAAQLTSSRANVSGADYDIISLHGSRRCKVLPPPLPSALPITLRLTPALLPVARNTGLCMWR